DRHRASPEFLRADAGEIDRRLAVHARRRRHVGIELIAGNDADAVVLPALIVRMGMAVIVSCHCRTFESEFRARNASELARGRPAESQNFWRCVLSPP